MRQEQIRRAEEARLAKALAEAQERARLEKIKKEEERKMMEKAKVVFDPAVEKIIKKLV